MKEPDIEMRVAMLKIKCFQYSLLVMEKFKE